MTLIDVRHARDAQAAAAAAAAVQLRWMLVIVMHDHELTALLPSVYVLSISHRSRPHSSFPRRAQ